MLSKFSSVPTRTEGFIHTMKAVENQTVGWAELLPKIIHDEQELRAAAILCSHSNVRPFFHPCRISVTEDAMFIKIEMHRRNQPQHIAVDDVTAVDHELPPTFGVEELGNPLCGVRFTIKLNTEKTYVFYARTQADRVQWSDWLQNIVSRKRENERNYYLRKNQQRVERGTVEYERDILNMKEKDEHQARAFLQRDSKGGGDGGGFGGPIFLGSSRDSPLRRGAESPRRSSPVRDAPGSLGPLRSPQSKQREIGARVDNSDMPTRNFTLPVEYDRLGNPVGADTTADLLDPAQARHTRDHTLSGYLLNNPSLDLAPDAASSSRVGGAGGPVASFRLVDRMSPVQRRLDDDQATNHEEDLIAMEAAANTTAIANGATRMAARNNTIGHPRNSTLIVEKHSGEARHYETDSMSHAQLAPVVLEEDVPTNRHLMWRYSPTQMKLWAECSVERHEQMRQLKNLKCPGRWDEFGQTSASQKKYADQEGNKFNIPPPNDPNNISSSDGRGGNGGSNGGMVGGGRKIPTAKEVMGGLSKDSSGGVKNSSSGLLMNNPELNSSEIVGDASHSREVSRGDGLILRARTLTDGDDVVGDTSTALSDGISPTTTSRIAPSQNTVVQSHELDAHFPWVSLDDVHLTYEEQMNLLLKLASTRVDDRYLYNPPSTVAHSDYGGRDVLVSQFDGELDHYPLPRGLTSQEVRPHFDALYEGARSGVDALKNSLFERVGVVRHAAPINRREVRTAHDLTQYNKSITPLPGMMTDPSAGGGKVDILDWAEETYQKEEAAREIRRRREEERQQLLETQRRARDLQENTKGQKVVQGVKNSDIGQFASFLM